MIKLDVKNNAFHTLRHAIEHLAAASNSDECRAGRQLDEAGECIVSTQDGRQSFQPISPLGRRPARYELKFALLHLIQSCELLLKAYLVESHGPSSILEGKSGQKTITIHKALSLASSGLTNLLTVDEFELLCRANDLRNQVQHFELSFQADYLRRTCVDFLVICCLLSQRLLGVNVISELIYDPWVDGEDPLGTYLSTLAWELSPASRPTTDRIAAEWRSRNPTERVALCITCSSQAFVPALGICTACGAEGDESVSAMVEDLADITRRIAELGGSSPQKL